MKLISLYAGFVLAALSCALTCKSQRAGADSILLGVHSRADLERPPYRRWFDSGYAAYHPDPDVLARLTPLLEPYTFRVFMGTWCADSRREVPRMLKVLDDCGVPADKVQIVMVDYRGKAYKQSPGHEERGQGIAHVPDLLVLGPEGEVGRIVESPVTTLEQDLLSIGLGQAYTPRYGGAWWLWKQFRGPSEAALRDSLRDKVNDPDELITLGYTLRLAGDTGRAMLCFRLDTALYPGNPKALDFLSGKQ